MKIGILTYHYSNNYGGVLQSYALYSYLVQKGHEVEIIDYVPKKVNFGGVFSSLGLRKNIFKMQSTDIKMLPKRLMIKLRNNKKIVQKFDDFRSDYCNLSERVDEFSINKIVEKYDMLISGSDQVWSPGQRKKEIFFLDFNNYKGLRVSYAPDSTNDNVDDEQLEDLKRKLGNFDFITTRNQHTQSFVQKITKEKVPMVVDPTLLVSFDKFMKPEMNKKMGDYILVYVLGSEISITNKKFIKRVKEQLGNYKVIGISIPTTKFNFIDSYVDEVLYNVGPIEWLNYIKNAKFILTDSFHGTLFSIKFKKPFVAYYSESIRSSRFLDLIDRYGLKDMIIDGESLDDINRSIIVSPNYEYIEKTIEHHKDMSMKRLDEILELENRISEN